MFAIPFALLFATPVFAELGGNVSSVQSDQAHMKAATVQVTRGASYNVHEMKAAGGTAVREFVTPGGQVFGIAWAGQFRPDLKQVLGNYYEQFLAAASKNKRSGHGGSLTIEEPGLVVQMAGHQRYSVGRAWIPNMLPQGVQTAEIK